MMIAALVLSAGLLPVIPQPVEGRSGDESYELRIAADGSAEIKAEGRGRVWAEVTYAQLKAMGAAKPGLVVKDGPKYRVRAAMLDVARKFFPMDFLRDLVRTMSWYKLNELHLHLNDNSAGGRAAGFRIECETCPGLTSADGAYTKAEFREFVKWAATLGVNVVPEFDSPAHVGAFARFDASLASKKGENYFDLSNPKTVEFMKRLFEEYLGGKDPVFAGPDFSVGTDEYEGGDPELFRAYTDRMFALVRAFGKKPRAWGALTQMAGRTKVNPRDVTLDIWNNGYYRPADAIRDGFKVICVPDNLVYIVPSAGYYYDWLDCRRLFGRWEPCDFDGWTAEPNDARLAGGKFALWNDKGEEGCDLNGAWARLLPAIQTLGQKMWSGAVAGQDWEAFRTLAWKMPEAPGVRRTERAVGLYLVVDLGTHRLCTLDAAPPTGWETEDFTDRIVFRRVASTNGTYYVALDETSQAQYERITGDNPAMERGPTRPVEHVNFDEAAACVARLNALTGETGFALPTGAEWDGAFAEKGRFRNISGGVSEWTSDLWKGNPEIRLMRDGDRKPRPSRGASRTGSLREGFRMVYRPGVRHIPSVRILEKPRKASTPPALDARPQAPNEKYAKYYMQRHNWFIEHKAEEGEGAVVFIGDSITEGYAGSPVYKRTFVDPKTRAFKGFNLGYDGDRTENVIWRIWNGQLDGYKAKAVVLLIGTNNLANDHPEADVLKGIDTIITLIREKQPQAKLIVSALLPRGGKDDPLREKARTWNVEIERLALKRGVQCVNFWNRFLDAEGNLLPKTFGDGLHPTAAGYEIWTEALLPLLRTDRREFTLFGLEGEDERKDGTVFTIRDEGERVSFRFDVKDPTVCTVPDKKVEFDLAYADRVEVYLCPTPMQEKGYLCVEIDALGRPLDYHVTDDHRFFWDWNYRTLKASGRTVDGGYVVEGSVAKSELAEYGIDVSRCWIGVFRADCPAAREQAAWYSAMPMAPRPHFHRKGMVFPLSLGVADGIPCGSR